MKFKAILFALLVSLGVSASATASTVTPVPGEAHVQNIGWMPQTTQTIGTTGRALRLEAVRLYGFPLDYQAHVQNIGWMPWVGASYEGVGETAGTTGRSLRMEAIRIRLVPTAAMFGSVEYRCHVQNLGWLAWTRDGGTCGTTGKSLRMEALQVRFVPHTPTPEPTTSDSPTASPSHADRRQRRPDRPTA
jgi:uncharacterized protein YjdB